MGGPKNTTTSVQPAPVQQCSECDGKENEICKNFIPDFLNTSKCRRCGHKKESHINKICNNFMPDNLDNSKCTICGHTEESHIKHKIRTSMPHSNVSTKHATAAIKGGRLPYKSRTKKRTKRYHKKHTQRRHKKN